MLRYIIVSIGNGLLFGVLDGVVNANPLAQKLYQVYAPIAKKSINPIAGIGIDLAYGFIMAGVFLLLYKSLPGQGGFVKGLSFGLLVWFFRVVMSAASTWMMFEVPANTILYNLATGLGEMLILGAIYGLAIRPR
ncbi:MAG: hypothetical protein MUO77_21045 [Anaerolineales bacterium]|nr:hypothetical protein [Anaerolineales bacterium]